MHSLNEHFWSLRRLKTWQRTSIGEKVLTCPEYLRHVIFPIIVRIFIFWQSKFDWGTPLETRITKGPLWMPGLIKRLPIDARIYWEVPMKYFPIEHPKPNNLPDIQKQSHFEEIGRKTHTRFYYPNDDLCYWNLKVNLQFEMRLSSSLIEISIVRCRKITKPRKP